MNSLATQIENVIALRGESAKRIQPIAAKLQESNDCLEGVVRFVAEHGDRFDGGTKSVLTALSTEAKTLQDRVREHGATLDRLLTRFRRPTLNIGVAGTARQGKSTLLQSLSGLSEKIIPSGSGNHCTGAPCVITNAEGPVRARITFHTERSFREEVVHPFRDELGLPVEYGSSIDAFRQFPLPPKKSPGEDGYSEGKEVTWQRLREIKATVEQFRGNLGREELEIEEGEIRRYVAQEDESGKPIHAWRAVKLANVLCQFPQKELGRITLLDTPGLGDFNSGAERRLMATIVERFDVVLLVRRPDDHSTNITKEDVAFFALVGSAIPGLKPADWCFLVLNLVGNNQKQCSGFLENLQKEANARTKEVFEVSCKDLDGTQKMFGKVVEYLAKDIQGMDLRYAECRLAPIPELGADIHSFAERAAKVLPSGVRALDQNLFNGLFGKVWEDMSHALKQLLGEYRGQRGQPDPVFSGKLAEVCRKLEEDPKLPPIEQITREMNTVGNGVWHIEKMHDLRNQMCGEFLALDDDLKARFDELRDRVRDILAGEKGGRLTAVVPTVESRQWLAALAASWAEFAGSENIRRDILFFAEAGLKTRGFMLPRIRACMDVLDPESGEAETFMLPAGGQAGDSVQRLTVAWQKAGFEISKVTGQFEVESSDAQFAELETLVDSIIRGRGAQAMKELWAVFYQEHRGELWAEQFGDMERTMRLRSEWKQLAGELTSLGIALQSTNTPFKS